MGWRGVLRDIEASGRRTARNAERRQRAADKQCRIDEKADAAERVRYEVELHDDLLRDLRSMHRECGPGWDWRAMADAPAPAPPCHGDEYTQTAKHRLAAYTPTFWDWFLARGGERRESLRDAVVRARHKDRETYVENVRAHNGALTAHADAVEFARRMLKNDLEAFSIAVRDFGLFSGLPIVKNSMLISVPKHDVVHVVYDCNSDNVVPRTVKRVLATGLLSVKEMPKYDYTELQRNYLCSSLLRVARETIALLPVETAIVTACRKRPNLQTGHLELLPIASAAVPRLSLQHIQWDSVHPQYAMNNFIHRVDFRDDLIIPITPFGVSDV